MAFLLNVLVPGLVLAFLVMVVWYQYDEMQQKYKKRKQGK